MTESATRVPFSFSVGNRSKLMIFVSFDNERDGNDKYRMFIGNSPEGNEPAVLQNCQVLRVNPHQCRCLDPIHGFVVLYQNRVTPVDTVEDCTVLALEDYVFEETDETVTITKK